MHPELRDALRDALHDLTDDVAHRRPTPDASRDLWTSGVRRRRGATLTKVLVAAAVVPLLAFVAQALPVPARQVEPAADDAPGAVPDHFWSPGVWADGTEDAPPGRLALVAEAERGTWWGGRHISPYGVTAADQDYVWLDLRGQSDESGEVALSPDGRWVGYWLAGTPRRADKVRSDVVGIAAYDTVTGAVRSRRILTEHGLAPSALTWSSDSDRLVAAYGQHHRRPGLSSDSEVVSWAPGPKAPTRVPGLDGSWDLSPGLGGVVSGGEGGLLAADVRAGTTSRLPLEASPELTDGGLPDSVVPDPSGSRVAMRGVLPLGDGISTYGLWVAEREGSRFVDARLLDRRWQLNRVLGWLDDDRVLAEAHRRGGYGVSYVAYDVRTGRAEPVIRHTDPTEWSLSADFAVDLLRQPLVGGRPPEHPMAPHWWLVPVLALAGAAAGVLRRSRRPVVGA